MENILVVGTNTRPIACSLKSIDYDVYSVDYFGCQDLKTCVNYSKSFLSQKPFQSCGFFSQNFDPELLIKMSEDYAKHVDKIIYGSGISPINFPKHKLIGNRDVGKIENKYKLYKQLEKSFEGVFKLPETYLVKDIHDAQETVDSSEVENFLLKPIEGSGGIGIRNFDSVEPHIEINGAILQEIVEGVDVSTSVLSTGDEATTILTTQQLIGKNWLGQKGQYGYCGNIAPYTGKKSTSSNQKCINEVAEEVVSKLKLIGSNGVDMIIKNGDLHVIEVNPRLQGTFEIAEACLGINMAEAHIMACEGEMMDIPAPKKFAVKMIIFAQKRSQVGNLDIEGVYDKPYSNVIIEEGEPLATVLTSRVVLEDSIYISKNNVEEVYKNLKPVISQFN
jgi:predicted ATP-grasp superfamily ATP-dependent carboligase